MNKSELIDAVAASAGLTKRTGAELKIAARKAPAFTAGKTLKDSVN